MTSKTITSETINIIAKELTHLLARGFNLLDEVYSNGNRLFCRSQELVHLTPSGIHIDYKQGVYTLHIHTTAGSYTLITTKDLQSDLFWEPIMELDRDTLVLKHQLIIHGMQVLTFTLN